MGDIDPEDVTVRRVSDGRPLMVHPELEFLSKRSITLFVIALLVSVSLGVLVWWLPSAAGVVCAICSLIVFCYAITIFLQIAKNRELEYRLLVLERAMGIVVDVDSNA